MLPTVRYFQNYLILHLRFSGYWDRRGAVVQAYDCDYVNCSVFDSHSGEWNIKYFNFFVLVRRDVNFCHSIHNALIEGSILMKNDESSSLPRLIASQVPSAYPAIDGIQLEKHSFSIQNSYKFCLQSYKFFC